LICCWSRKPIPPPPTKPMMVDIRTLMSQRYIVKAIYGGTICGQTA